MLVFVCFVIYVQVLKAPPEFAWKLPGWQALKLVGVLAPYCFKSAGLEADSVLTTEPDPAPVAKSDKLPVEKATTKPLGAYIICLFVCVFLF